MEKAIGSLKAYKERVKGSSESSGAQLMLTAEEWEKKDGKEKKLLYTREERVSRSNKNGMDSSQYQRNRGARDKSKVRCFNCNALRHYAAECRKPSIIKEQRHDVNISQIEDDEPALLLAKFESKADDLMLVNETKVIPSKFPRNGGNKIE